MKRAISCLILAALLLSTAACSTSPASDTPPSSDSKPAETSAETLSFAEEHAAAKDSLPEANFNGASFAVTLNDFAGCPEGFVAEETTGDVLNDVVYQRNQNVQSRFNVVLEYVPGAYNKMPKLVQTSVAAGEDYYQLLNQHVNTAVSWVTGEILVDWFELKHVNFDNPWWSDANKTDLSYNGHSFLAAGDYGLTTIGRTYAIYYDKQEAINYQLPDLYTLVYDGKWTFDTMLSFTKDTYRDLNANGTRDTVEDFFGFTTSKGSNIGAFFWAFGEKIVKDGKVELNTSKMTDILAKMLDVCYNYTGTCYDLNYKNASGNTNYIGVEKMAQGTTLFCVGMIESGILYLRDMEHDYGIIPFPKWDEAQKDYTTSVDPGFTAMAIPKSVVNLERAGIMAEALCAETYRTVVAPYYELALKLKGARDPESTAMMDFILSKRVYDFGLVYDGGKGFRSTLQSLVQKNDPNFASYYAANIEPITLYYDELRSVFDNYGK